MKCIQNSNVFSWDIFSLKWWGKGLVLYLISNGLDNLLFVVIAAASLWLIRSLFNWVTHSQRHLKHNESDVSILSCNLDSMQWMCSVVWLFVIQCAESHGDHRATQTFYSADWEQEETDTRVLSTSCLHVSCSDSSPSASLQIAAVLSNMRPAALLTLVCRADGFSVLMVCGRTSASLLQIYS